MGGDEDATAPLRALVEAGTRAASSHNSQPWLFVLARDRLRILPDFGRRCPATDPDDHHLYASLGCAAENLALAAPAQGFQAEVSAVTDAGGGAAIDVELRRGGGRESPLTAAIPRRQCARAAYDGRPVPNESLRQLEAAATSARSSVVIITDPTRLAEIAEYVAEGNRAQAANRGWRDELIEWLRFNERDARRTGDGLWTRATGHPEVPRLLGRGFMKFAFSADAQNRKELPWIRSSGGVAVFASAADDPAHWIEAGRCYERFALQATLLGLRNAFINQPVEVEQLRQQFCSWLGLGTRRADLVVRFGYGAEMPRSLRRPVDSVIVAEDEQQATGRAPRALTSTPRRGAIGSATPTPRRRR